MVIRNPTSVRPWQFVLDPLRGYLTVAERCLAGEASCADAWNFGPDARDARPVAWVAERFAEITGLQIRVEESGGPHEAHALSLDCSKAMALLKWGPCLDTGLAIEWTAAWYRAQMAGEDARAVSLEQIRSFEALCPVGGGCKPVGRAPNSTVEGASG